MNRVVLIGRLVAMPQMTYSKNNAELAITQYTLAVTRNYKNANGEYDADFIRCVSYGKTAEFAAKYFRKGQKVAIGGRIQTGTYVNKDGAKVYTTDIIVSEQEFAESKKDTEDAAANTDSKDTQVDADGFSELSSVTDDVLFGE